MTTESLDEITNKVETAIQNYLSVSTDDEKETKFNEFFTILTDFKEKIDKDIESKEKQINIKELELKKQEELIKKDMSILNKNMKMNDTLNNEKLKMSKKVENMETHISKKNNIIYILFIVNFVFALCIIAGIGYKIYNKNVNLSKVFETKIKN